MRALNSPPAISSPGAAPHEAKGKTSSNGGWRKALREGEEESLSPGGTQKIFPRAKG